MTAQAVSVIVVSRHRPDALLRCLAALEQLDFDMFEIVVVADHGAMEAVRRAGFGGRIKAKVFDAPNISAARNLGIGAAGGGIAAFIDDDSVPEPTWLRYLAEPFAQPDVAAAGGFVRGRNGISFQSRGRSVDATGRHEALDLPAERFHVFRGAPGCAIKTEGTNCAFRLDVLRRMGGFDPAYRFYLDETDLNLRLAAEGARTAIVPLAQVHHGFAASERRHASRLPRDLFEIGASQALFLRRHAPDRVAPVLADFKAEQRRRLLRFMVGGQCEPRDVGRVLRTLEAGIQEGLARPLSPLPALQPDGAAFLPFEPRRRFTGMRTLAGRSWQRRALRTEAARAVQAGHRATLYLFSPTALYHRVMFHPAGFWEQRGGLFGRSERTDRVFSLASFKRRLAREETRVRSVRKGL